MKDRTKVDSSNLKSIGYDGEGMILEVEFKGGSVYRYFGVSSEIHRDLMSAQSKGSYFYKKIKNNFKFEKQNGTIRN